MRRGLLILGCLSLAAAWLIPLAPFGRHAFWAHMTMHVLVVAVAAPLLALGVAGGKFDPVPSAPKLFAPIPVSIVELIVVWAWHAPLLHHAARHSTAGLVAEQTTFLLTGLAMWLSAFGSNSAGAGSRRAAGVVGLLLTSMHMTLLGALLALAPRPLYHHAEAHATPHSGTDRPMVAFRSANGRTSAAPKADTLHYGAALTPLDDQHLGGAIMLLVGGVSYLAGGLWLTLGLMRSSALKAEEKP